MKVCAFRMFVFLGMLPALSVKECKVSAAALSG